MPDTDTTLTDYLVTLYWGAGYHAQLEVPTMFGPQAAARRAWWSAAHLGWTDLDTEVTYAVEDEATGQEWVFESDEWPVRPVT